MTECTNPRCRRTCAEFLCAECGEQLLAALDRVPWLLDELAVTELRQDRVSRGLRTGRAPRSPLLFDPTSGELRAALINTITTWARHLCESRGIEYVPEGYVSRRFVGPLRWPHRHAPTGIADIPDKLAAWLGDHLMSVRLDDAAGELYRDVTRSVAAGLELINARPRQIFRGPCPTVVGRTSAGAAVECGTPLYADAVAEIAYSSATDDDRPSPAAFVTCPRCGVLHDTTRLESRLLSKSDALVFDVPSLVRILRELGEPLSRGTIVSWISRGKLAPAAWQHDGRTVARRQDDTDKPLYRLGAVRKLRADGSRGKTA